MTDNFPYEDIVNFPPHLSEKHPQPTMLERAARFAPFAAVTGYEEMVLEAARTTEERTELDESALAILNEKLNVIHEFIGQEPEVKVTYFEPDQRKAGGAYVSMMGRVKHIDEYKRLIVLTDGKKIGIDDIFDLECRLFDSLGW